MSSTAFSRTFVSALVVGLAGGCAAVPPAPLFSDDFADLSNWHIEAEKPGRITAHAGALDIDVPAGVTLWFRPKLGGPVTIEFEATAVLQGGPNDQVSDLNVFWMANNRDGAEPVYARPRSGKFADYNDLLTYYVGLGGNRNTTTRFRRYVGDAQLRPLLLAHDLGTADVLLVPNKPQVITLIANGRHIEYRRDGKTLFRHEDATPYVNGWFALRTTFSHLRIRSLRVYAGILPSRVSVVRRALPPTQPWLNRRASIVKKTRGKFVRRRLFVLKGGGSAYIMRAPGQGTRKSLPRQTIFEHC